MGVPGAPGRGSGQELERCGVGGAHDSEVAVVERREAVVAVAFGDGDETDVDDAQAEVGVGGDQLDAALVVVDGEVDHGESAGGGKGQEPCFGRGAEAVLDQPGGLGESGAGGDESAPVCGQEPGAVSVAGLVGVRRSDEHAGVHQQPGGLGSGALGELAGGEIGSGGMDVEGLWVPR